MRRLIGFLAMLAVLAGASLPPPAAAQQAMAFERSRLEIRSGDARHEFEVELALTPEQQTRGLMFRRSMPADAGMLFVHPRDQVVNMWMRNTVLPLDMLFVAADGRIVRIVERTVPYSRDIVSSGRPVRAVLEVNAGTVRRLGLEPGDRLIHPLLGG